ncbi:hypothetical protein FWH13_03015 [Candidatus Saccharibacteria bacterium]|nr:hypothetical protein [Candidatus Saccharibacteria bacterium]
MNNKIIEQLAAVEHERWADWQKWCHQVIRENSPSHGTGDVLKRWDRQIETPYLGLSEQEKESAREQVRRYLPIVEQEIRRAELAARLAEIDQWEKHMPEMHSPLATGLSIYIQTRQYTIEEKLKDLEEYAKNK